MIKDVVSILTCECKRSTIILDERLQGTEIERCDALCPVCGNEFVSSKSVDITIGNIKDDESVYKNVMDIKKRVEETKGVMLKSYVDDFEYLLKLLEV